jgi:hypothetical protein
MSNAYYVLMRTCICVSKRTAARPASCLELESCGVREQLSSVMFHGVLEPSSNAMSCGRSDARCVMARNVHGLLQGSSPIGAPVQSSNRVSVVGVKFTALSA